MSFAIFTIVILEQRVIHVMDVGVLMTWKCVGAVVTEQVRKILRAPARKGGEEEKVEEEEEEEEE